MLLEIVFKFMKRYRDARHILTNLPEHLNKPAFKDELAQHLGSSCSPTSSPTLNAVPIEESTIEQLDLHALESLKKHLRRYFAISPSAVQSTKPPMDESEFINALNTPAITVEGLAEKFLQLNAMPSFLRSTEQLYDCIRKNHQHAIWFLICLGTPLQDQKTTAFHVAIDTSISAFTYLRNCLYRGGFLSENILLSLDAKDQNELTILHKIMAQEVPVLGLLSACFPTEKQKNEYQLFSDNAFPKLNPKNRDGSTPLSYALKSFRKKIRLEQEALKVLESSSSAPLLLSKEAPKACRNKNASKLTALTPATSNKSAASARAATVEANCLALLKYEPCIDTEDLEGWTPLALACQLGFKDLSAELLRKNAVLISTDPSLPCPLTLAIAQSFECVENNQAPELFETIISILVEKNKDLASINYRGFNLLHIAVLLGSAHATCTLVDNAPELVHQLSESENLAPPHDTKECTPYEIALQMQNKAILVLLPSQSEQAKKSSTHKIRY